MTTTPSDNPLQGAWDPYRVMNDDLAVAHGTAEYEGSARPRASKPVEWST
jgi:hypothetical protein